MWAVIIVFVSMIGPILYFLVGREDGPVEPQAPGPGAMPGWGSPHDPPIVAPVAPSQRPVDPSPPPVADPPSAAGPRPDANPSAIVIEDLTKRYPGGIVALESLTMTVPAGLGVRAARPERGGQDDDAPAARRPHAGDRRAGVHRRGRGHARRPGRAARPRLPRAGPAGLRLDDGPRPAAHARPAPRPGRPRRSRGRSTTRSVAWTWRPQPTAGPAPTRAACGSASGSPARWSTARAWRSSTSP